MRPSRHNDIRTVLLRNEDGLTAKEIASKIDMDVEAVKKALPNIYGVYIDRWLNNIGRGAPSAVYVCVPIPENTTQPTRIKK
jgi:predicted transcriptional regulator